MQKIALLVLTFMVIALFLWVQSLHSWMDNATDKINAIQEYLKIPK